MYNQENLHAVILISEDNLFVIHCINLLRTIHENAFYERVFGKEDFEVLMSELLKEGFNAALIIIDNRTKGNEIISLFKIIRQFERAMKLEIKLGIEDI
jgi:hypothetical protein